MAAPALAGPPTAYVANQGDDTVTPIDLATKTAGTPIPVGHNPVAVAITPDGKTAYVVNFETQFVQQGTVTPIDTQTNTPGPPITVDYGARAIAISPDGATAYVAADGDQGPGDPADVTPIDIATNTAGTPGPACGSECAGIAVTPNGKRGYATDIRGYLNPLKPPSTSCCPSIPLGNGTAPQGIVITQDGKTAYVALSGRYSVVPVDIPGGTVGSRINVGPVPYAIALNPDGKSAYVTNSGNGSVTPINTRTDKPGARIPVGNGPQGIAIAPDGETAYVTNSSDGTVTPIHTRSKKPGSPITVGASPQGIAITPDLDPPQTSISRKPANPGHKVSIFSLASSDPSSTFECSLDAKRFKSCNAEVIYRNLPAGSHIFKARATDLSGNTDPTPAKIRFHIRTHH